MIRIGRPSTAQTRLLRRLAAAGGRLIRTNTPEGSHYSDAAGNDVPAKAATRLIANRLLIPDRDGLFDLTPQSWRVRRPGDGA
jgi:hypothetical protein